MAHPVTSIAGSDISSLLAPQGGQRQPMQGFDPEFVDIVDYIVRITYRIWEEKQVNRIYDYYSHNCLVHTPRGDSFGREQVLAGTVQTLHTFPDRRLFADDVVWGGNDVNGFYSSHRITSTGHHYGYSAYGAPTGKALRWRVIADCVVKANRIVEEWLVRDELSIVQQLGLDVPTVVAGIARQLPRSYFDDIQAQAERIQGQTTPAVLPPAADGFDATDFVCRTLHEVWNWRAFDRIYQHYAPTYQCHAASGRELYGQAQYLQFVLAWLAAFPDARLLIDHSCAVGNEQEGYRTAVRWNLVGTHAGYSSYGPPTGRPVRIMGISQHRIKAGKLIEEWTVFDELALLAQLSAAVS